MPIRSFAHKTKAEILRAALQKLEQETPITSIGPGSVVRSLSEVVVDEISDFYAAMDFNTSMGLISSAQGRALDLIGELYSVNRKQLGQLATVDQSVGAFYFFIDEPHNDGDIVIPRGTLVSTDAENFIGDTYTYATIDDATIPAGRTRVFVGLRPQFLDSVFTAGKNTIVRHNVSAASLPEDVVLKCTNPKTIAPQEGYESDVNYRARIVQAVRTSAGGTSSALRFTALAVEGVRDVRMRPSVYGLGSVEAIVVPERVTDSSSVVPNVIEEMNKVRPVGVKLVVREPDYIAADIVATISIRSGTGVDQEGTQQRARLGINRYLNTLLPGDKLVFSRLIQSVLEASDVITDVVFTRLRINGTEVLRSNFQPEAFQQIIPGEITISAS